jgi:hypothetical protein
VVGAGKRHPITTPKEHHMARRANPDTYSTVESSVVDEVADILALTAGETLAR